MNWYTYLFSPDTYEAFLQTDRKNAGVRKRQEWAAGRVQRGDVLGLLPDEGFSLDRITGSRGWTPEPRSRRRAVPVRRQVKPLVLLKDVEYGLPIHDPEVWAKLSFTRKEEPTSSRWTGKLRRSLFRLDESDGAFLDCRLRRQDEERRAYPLSDDDRKKMTSPRVQRVDAVVSVSIPRPDLEPDADGTQYGGDDARTSHQVQAALARLGADLGLDVWVPRNDRERILAASEATTSNSSTGSR